MIDDHERRDTLTRQVHVFQGQGYEVDEYPSDYEVLMVKEHDTNDILHAIGCLLFPVWVFIWFAISFRNNLLGPKYARIYVDDYGVVSVTHSRESMRDRATDMALGLFIILLVVIVIALVIVGFAYVL